jgi:hypothetical protein
LCVVINRLLSIILILRGLGAERENLYEPVSRSRLGDGQSLHEPGQLAVLLGPEDQVPVIAHDAERTEPDGRPFQRFVQCPNKRGKVLFMAEEVSLPRRAVQDVVNQSPWRLAGLSWDESIRRYR